jgi:hypothetical protein
MSSAISITPSAARLTESLRDIGYDFPAAIADLVDNSIVAGAWRIDIVIEFDGSDSRVFLIDDGYGMTESELVEALRFGSRRDYSDSDLGRYGLGLKTASLSQCRRMTVVTRRSEKIRRLASYQLDLDLISEVDAWIVVPPDESDAVGRARAYLHEAPGTVVLWQDLDRVLPERDPEGGWARRRLASLAEKTAEHLGVVFHRYLDGLADGHRVMITVNGEKIAPWNPFAPEEPATVELPPQRFEIQLGDSTGTVYLRRFVLPSRDGFSSATEFDRLSGPLKWNRQQGLYVYRADRLVQWGGWNGIRAIDEHTKLARASLDFDPVLDAAFNINVAKMRASVPAQLRQMLERPIHELCLRADDVYRKTSPRMGNPAVRVDRRTSTTFVAPSAGLALRSAAMVSGEYEAFTRILAALRDQAPEITSALGLDD